MPDKITAIKNTILELKSVPHALNHFLSDLENGLEKHWSVFRHEFSNLAMEEVKGRRPPTKPPKVSGLGRADKWGKMHHRNKIMDKHIPQLPLHKCKTDEEKVSMILAANTTPEIKADLISGVFQ